MENKIRARAENKISYKLSSFHRSACCLVKKSREIKGKASTENYYADLADFMIQLRDFCLRTKTFRV